MTSQLPSERVAARAAWGRLVTDRTRALRALLWGRLVWQMTGMVLAPLFVPVELQRMPGSRRSAAPALRYFRLAVGLDDGGDCLRLRSAVPDELRAGLIRVRFHLPPPTAEMAQLLGGAWEGEVTVTAEASTVVVDAGSEQERTEARLLVFRSVLAPVREQLVQYATLRLQGD